jgi:hypothetical protein
MHDRMTREHDEMQMDDTPVVVRTIERRMRERAQMHRDMELLRREIRELREQLKQKSQN